MKIAFEASTFNGNYSENILKVFFALEGMGHEMFVWSVNYIDSVKTLKTYGLNATPINKYSNPYGYGLGDDPMDCAIDDSIANDFLARLVIFPHEIPNDTDVYATALDKVLTAANNVTEAKNGSSMESYT